MNFIRQHIKKIGILLEDEQKWFISLSDDTLRYTDDNLSINIYGYTSCIALYYDYTRQGKSPPGIL